MDLSLSLPLAALLLAALVIADFFVPMLPSATTIATVAGFLVGDPWLIAGLIACSAAASWLGDVLGHRTLRHARARLRRPLPGSAKVAEIEAGLRETLHRRPRGTTLIARFLPAGRTALAWAAVDAPGYRHGRMAAMAAIAWACYMVGLGLLIGWLLGPGLYSAATTVSSVAAAGFVLGWWFKRASAKRRRPVSAPHAEPAPPEALAGSCRGTAELG